VNITGITVVKDGKEVDQFFIYCENHGYYYNGRPPLVSGCRDCWEVYYTGQVAQSPGDKKELTEQLESAVRHAAELEDKGMWDFVPDHKVEFSTEN